MRWQRWGSTLLNLLFIWPTMTFAANIYMQTNKSGAVEFSDYPAHLSSPVILKRINSYNAFDNLAVPTEQKQLTNPMNAYEKIIILTPQPAQTYQNSQTVPVNIEVIPTLKSADKIEIWLDGNLYQRGTETQITLQGIDRGEHYIQIKIMNAQGKMLISSKIITFYIHKAVSNNAGENKT